jgi:hypothetical protein
MQLLTETRYRGFLAGFSRWFVYVKTTGYAAGEAGSVFSAMTILQTQFYSTVAAFRTLLKPAERVLLNSASVSFSFSLCYFFSLSLTLNNQLGCLSKFCLFIYNIIIISLKVQIFM